jgi:hypothetical protein
MTNTTTISPGLYRSHQDERGFVWLNLKYESGRSGYSGRIEVHGGGGGRYRIYRVGSVGPETSSGFEMVRIGSAGVVFERRKDAENYALIAALAINGDVRRRALVDPEVFGGVREWETPGVASWRTDFWKGADHIDPCSGWNKIDPDSLLLNLPKDNLFFIDEEDDEFSELAEDSPILEEASIWSLAVAIRLYYSEHLQLESLNRPYDTIVQEIAERKGCYFDPKDGEFTYAKLLALSFLRDSAPTNWLFPCQEDNIFFPKGRLKWTGIT